MKRFIKNSALFFSLLVCAYVLLIIIWGNFAPAPLRKNLEYPFASYGHMYSRMEEVKKTQNIDILFLGSSHAYRGFDPRIFGQQGYKTFNLGSSSQTPLQTKILLERYLNQLNPKMIIYDVYPAVFTMDGVEASLDLIANDTIDNRTFMMAKQLNNVKTYNTLVYGHYRQLFGCNKDYKEASYKDADTYIPGGFVERNMSYYSPSGKKPLEITWSPIKRQEEAFENILMLIHKKKIKLLLVQTPVTKTLYHSYSNNNEIDAYFMTKGEYYNFNKILALDDSLHFYNSDHLNQQGVRIFNEHLLKTVLKKPE